MLPVWPVATILPTGKDVRRKRAASPDKEKAASDLKKKKNGRKRIDLYA
ncbi:hypothetical protein [Thiolapillus sp.]|nr:hypothetical protein [Thiolapillus sp.]